LKAWAAHNKMLMGLFSFGKYKKANLPILKDKLAFTGIF
jgi:hypothetical protein